MTEGKLREIDAAIAKALGFRNVEQNDEGYWIARHINREVGGGYTPFCSWHEIPHFTTRIQDAWQLVEEMDEEFQYCQIDTGKPCIVYVSPDYNFGEYLGALHQAQAETAPLAISLAYLKAKGIEIEL